MSVSENGERVVPDAEELQVALAQAQRLLDVPIAFVSWVREAGLEMRSARGLNLALPVLESRILSLAGLGLDAALAIADTTLHDRASSCTLVTREPYVRSFAASPIVVERDRVGVLCVASIAPRIFDVRALEVLDLLAAGIARSVLTARTKHALVETQRALDSLRLADASKSRFLGVLSHEMRTPLASMIGSIELASTSDGDERRLALDRARRSGRGLLRFTEDVLDFARTHSGTLRLSPQPIELRALLDEVTATARELARGKTVRIELVVAPDVPKTVNVDGQRVGQVLGNLLSNAFKVAPQGQVKLEARFAPVEAGTVNDARVPLVEFIVSDDGPGIAKEDQERIFEPFEQLSLGRRVGGTGLGLSISRALVHQMRGSITVVSELGAGAVFRVRIPMQKTRARVSSSAAALPRLVRGAHVLVIDDDEDNRYVLARFLERAGCIVESTDDPQLAITRAADPRFQAIVTDNAMPLMDGPKLARAIRQKEGNARRIRIVGVTADADVGTRDRCLASGMDAWLVKPVSANALLDAVMGAPVAAEVAAVAPLPTATPIFTSRDSAVEARVERYLERRGLELEEVRRALLVGDMNIIARIGHNLRGSGGSFGFPALTELGGALEDAAKTGALNTVATTLMALEVALVHAQTETKQRKT